MWCSGKQEKKKKTQNLNKNLQSYFVHRHRQGGQRKLCRAGEG